MILFLSLLTFFIAAGKLLDYFLYKDEKVILYKKMGTWVDTISKTEFPKLHLLMIDWVLRILNSLFNWKKRPIRTFLNLVIISWLLTSVMCIIGHIHPLRWNFGMDKWHDILPWYPIYIVNFIFDLIALIITKKLLEAIRNKKTIYVLLGISIDLILSYVLLVFCLISFDYSVLASNKLGIGSKYVSDFDGTVQNVQFREIQFDKNSFLRNSIPLRFFKRIKNEGFSNKSKVQFNFNLNFYEYFKYKLSITLNVIYHLIKNEKYLYEMPYVLEVYENENKLIIPLKRGLILNPAYFLPSMTTFLPTIFYLVFLLIIYISKEILVLSKKIGLRTLKSARQNSTSEDISKFNPGIHFGILISFLIAMIKLVSEILKHFF